MSIRIGHLALLLTFGFQWMTASISDFLSWWCVVVFLPGSSSLQRISSVQMVHESNTPEIHPLCITNPSFTHILAKFRYAGPSSKVYTKPWPQIPIFSCCFPTSGQVIGFTPMSRMHTTCTCSTPVPAPSPGFGTGSSKFSALFCSAGFWVTNPGRDADVP